MRVSMQCGTYTPALEREKAISPLFPSPKGEVVANDWCIRYVCNVQIGSTSFLFYCSSFGLE